MALEGAADLPRHTAMVHRDGQKFSDGTTLRKRALKAISETQWDPEAEVKTASRP
jgi:hypothetical protein